MLRTSSDARLVWGMCRVPASAVNIQVDGEYQAMIKTTDNYWLATSGPYTFPTSVQVTSVLGDTVTDVVNVASPSGAVLGGAQFPLSAAYGVVGGMLPCTCHVQVLMSHMSACKFACSISQHSMQTGQQFVYKTRWLWAVEVVVDA